MDSQIAPPREPFEIRHQETVRCEIEEFRRRAAAVRNGQMSDDEFRAYRLRFGIYGQRQPGVQMVRIKIPGGALAAGQVMELAAVADEYAGGRAHLTTRQNVQFHFVDLARVADLMHQLADVGMTTREACFNTVRNVTCCPLAGLAHDEAFDVRPYARQVAFAFLRKQLTDNLPRKFKIAFEGCPRDCIRTAINDIGLRAVVRDGRRGFQVSIGGGLGALPREAHQLDDFLPEERLVNRCEAILRVFNNHGNRKNKNKARMKFILLERGFEWMREEIEKEYADILANGGIETPETVPEGFGGFQADARPRGDGRELPVLGGNGASHPDYERWLESNVLSQKQDGYALVTIRVPEGNLTSAQMRGVARLAESCSDGLVRITAEQNWALGWVPLAQLKRVYAALKPLGLALDGAGEIRDVVTCPGAYSCNLGLTKSMNLGAELTEAVAGYTQAAVRSLAIKISGCPNSCGQHWVADIGFYGNARKQDGREIPYYQMLLGGGYDEQGLVRFGLAVQSIAARLAPVAVRRVLDHFASNRLDGESFRAYVLRHKIEFFRRLTEDLAKPPEVFPDLYLDWGDDVAFSLKLGRGECAA